MMCLPNHSTSSGLLGTPTLKNTRWSEEGGGEGRRGGGERERGRGREKGRIGKRREKRGKGEGGEGEGKEELPTFPPHLFS